MNIHRPQFARHALCQRTDPVLGAGKRRKTCGAAQTGGGAGEQDRAPLALGHALGHFPAIEKA
ncbi:hypothetical protein D3C85_1913320 [compost metagenome]